jgi:hypothetical protein
MSTHIKQALAVSTYNLNLPWLTNRPFSDQLTRISPSRIEPTLLAKIVKDALNRVGSGYHLYLINTLIALSVELSNLTGTNNSDPIFFSDILDSFYRK